jgi:GTP-binding protein LepA
MTIINTVPNVEYFGFSKSGERIVVDNPAMMPDPGKIESVEEPYITAQIITPSEYIGNIMKLCMDRRGVYINTTYIDPTRADVHFELPLSEIIFDFYDKLKSVSRGYASFDYELLDYRDPTWSSSTSCSMPNRWMRCRASCTAKAYDWGRRCAASSRS